MPRVDTQAKEIKFWGGNIAPFLPLLTFIGSSMHMMITQKLSIELMIVSFMIGVILMLLLSKDFSCTWDSFEAGMASRISAIIVSLYTLIAIYSGLIQISQLAYGIIWLAGELGVTGSQFTVFSFLGCAVFATATGSTFATKAVLGFILYPVGLVVGSDPGVLLGAIFAGAAVGDNIGPVSDTTILSAFLQSYRYKEGTADIPGVVRSRLKYALIAGVICVIFYAFNGSTSDFVASIDSDLIAKNSNVTGLLMLMPMGLLLYIAMRNRDIFKALIAGIVATFVLGLLTGLFSFTDLLYISDAGEMKGGLVQGMSSGLLGMIILAVLFLGQIEVLKNSGAVDDLLKFFSRFARTLRSTEITIWILGTIFTPLSGCNPTGVVLLLSPLSDKMGKNVGIHPYRRANMIDAMATSWCYMLPFSLGDAIDL